MTVTSSWRSLAAATNGIERKTSKLRRWPRSRRNSCRETRNHAAMHRHRNQRVGCPGTPRPHYAAPAKISSTLVPENKKPHCIANRFRSGHLPHRRAFRANSRWIHCGAPRRACATTIRVDPGAPPQYKRRWNALLPLACSIRGGRAMRNGAEFYWDEKTAEQLRRVWRGEYFRSKANGAATAAATDDDDLDLAEWDWGDDNEPIPPRGWLLGNLLCRQFLTSIFADGGVGKTALIIAMALSLATCRNLIDEHVFVRCRVLLFCFEDGVNELRRRLTAAMMHYGITKDEIRGYLFISAINRADAKLATMRRGELVVGRLGAALE